MLEDLAGLKPDYVALRRDGGGRGEPRVVVPIWGVLEFDLAGDRLAQRAVAIAAPMTMPPRKPPI